MNMLRSMFIRSIKYDIFGLFHDLLCFILILYLLDVIRVSNALYLLRTSSLSSLAGSCYLVIAAKMDGAARWSRDDESGVGCGVSYWALTALGCSFEVGVCSEWHCLAKKLRSLYLCCLWIACPWLWRPVV